MQENSNVIDKKKNQKQELGKIVIILNCDNQKFKTRQRQDKLVKK